MAPLKQDQEMLLGHYWPNYQHHNASIFYRISENDVIVDYLAIDRVSIYSDSFLTAILEFNF